MPVHCEVPQRYAPASVLREKDRALEWESEGAAAVPPARPAEGEATTGADARCPLLAAAAAAAAEAGATLLLRSRMKLKRQQSSMEGDDRLDSVVVAA